MNILEDNKVLEISFETRTNTIVSDRLMFCQPQNIHPATSRVGEHARELVSANLASFRTILDERSCNIEAGNIFSRLYLYSKNRFRQKWKRKSQIEYRDYIKYKIWSKINYVILCIFIGLLRASIYFCSFLFYLYFLRKWELSC